MTRVGIHGIGVYLPEDVRHNDWWPDHIVATWRSADAHAITAMPTSETIADEGQRKVVMAMSHSVADPFHGSQTRHVLPADQQPSDMEANAAEAALEAAGIERGQIDFILQDGPVPDDLAVPNACIVHERLGLEERCLAISTTATCNAFAMQMELASALIATGKYRSGLLIQSNAVSRLIPLEARYAPWFGDGATAVVVGPVREGRGLLATVNRANGSLCDAMVAGVPGKRWYEEGRIWWHPRNRTAARTMLNSVARQAQQVIPEAVALAGLRLSDVTFYAAHQATRWFRTVTQESAGLSHANSLDTFPRAGSLSAANIPLVLATACREGMLKDGDIVVTFGGGSGITWSSMVLCWGR